MYFLMESREILFTKPENECLFYSFDIAGFEKM